MIRSRSGRRQVLLRDLWRSFPSVPAAAAQESAPPLKAGSGRIGTDHSLFLRAFGPAQLSL